MINKNELVSIIIPIYKVEKYLNKCINSIVNQTYSNIEIILIDDGSPDRCPFICDEWGKKDSRIKVLHKKNGGLSDARNFGIEQCKGDYIVFIDSDDYIEKNMIETLYLAITEDKSDIAICDYQIVEKGKNLLHKFSNKRFIVKDNKFDYLYNEYSCVTVVAWNKIYKREIFEKIRYPFGKIHEDEFIICDILQKANIISYVLEPLYYYVQRENSIMNKISLNRFDIVEALDKRINFFENDIKNRKITQKVQFFRLLGLLTRVYSYQSCSFNDKFIKEKLDKLQRLAIIVDKFQGLSIVEKIKVKIILFNPIMYMKIVKFLRK